MRLVRLAGIALVVAIGAGSATEAAAQPAFAPEAQSGWIEKGTVTGRRHMVAAASPLATEAGREILRQGGSAVDATIAVQLVLGLVEPQSSGLGGGAFLLHWDGATRRLASYDGRETAPAAARPDRFLVKGRPLPFLSAVKSPLSIGVPGTVRLLEHVHRRHGKLPWSALFGPAMRLASEGFTVSPRLARLLSETGPQSFAAEARAYFYDTDGKPRPAGYRLRNEAYLKTLAALAAGGADAFYTGPIAGQIVEAAAVRDPVDAGSLTSADLAGYKVIERPPLCIGYRKHEVCTMGPPSSAGHTIGQALLLSEPFDLGTVPSAAMAPASLHVLAEALKLAFADRNWYLADPAFVAIPQGLLAPGYIADRRRLLSPWRPLPRAYPGTPPGLDAQALGPDETNEAAGTSHISIVDAEGNAVAMTTTIEAGFGAGRWAAGFLLNNELTDFSFRPSRDGRPIANRVEGGKRPRSSMAPTIVLGPDGRLVAVTGSAGGSRIIAYVLKALVAAIDWKLDAAAALRLPNFATRGTSVELEQVAVGGLAGLRHPAGALAIVTAALGLAPFGQATAIETLTSGTQLILRRPDGMLEGAADPRREGLALGD
ncbi:MAG: gamma-glutamyltransferase family protein [Hyphomicrobiaceae bacterium]